MDMHESIARFLESSSSDAMQKSAATLLELMESDEVEPIDTPEDTVAAEDLAERLERRLEKLRRRGEKLPDGAAAIEDAVTYLRAHDGAQLERWSYEDGDGVRWFLLANDEDEEVVACYSDAPFVEADL